jgi:hypothetical protein
MTHGVSSTLGHDIHAITWDSSNSEQSDNLAAVRVRDLDMTLASVGITKARRGNTTANEADKNRKKNDYCITSDDPYSVSFHNRRPFFPHVASAVKRYEDLLFMFLVLS